MVIEEKQKNGAQLFFTSNIENYIIKGELTDEVSPELVELLHYIEHTTQDMADGCKSERIHKMQKRICSIKSSEEVYSIRITVNSIRNDGTTRRDPGNGGKPRKIKGFSELMKRGGTRIDMFFEKRAHFSEQKEKLSTLSTKRAGKPHKQRVPGSFLNWNE